MYSSVRGLVRCGSTPAVASFVRIAKHRAHQRWIAQVRWQSVVARTQQPRSTLALPSESRCNEIGVQQLSSYMHDRIFPGGGKPPPQHLVKLAQEHLRRHDLLDKNTDKSDPIAFEVPPLQGESQTLDEHFYRLGVDAAEPFLGYAKQFAQSFVPDKPKNWVRRSGWTKYPKEGDPEAVDVPDENMMCFDIEVMWKESPYAVMACAASPTAWYAWLSPWLLGETENEKQLIPLGDPTKERVIVGHNIGYDRARILEEYDLKQTRNSFLDTMSLHVAVNGMCSQQRPTWMKHKKNRELRDKIAQQTNNAELAQLLSSSEMSQEEEELWIGRSSINSLRDVAKFHLNIHIDKAIRDDFGKLNREEILEKLDDLLTYCAADVAITHQVYQRVFPHFLDVCPHPVSFAALRHLSNVILPVDESWDSYIANAEATYKRLSEAVKERLVSLTEKALAIKDDEEKWSNDPWLKQLDWKTKPIRWVKPKKKDEEPRMAKNQKMPGMPQWYKDLFPTAHDPMNLTVRTRIAPLLLRLAWDGHPLFWSDKYGWTFRVSREEMEQYASKKMVQCDMSDEPIALLKDDGQGFYFKVPHKDGPTARCANPMAKAYLSYFENGTLSSEFTYAKEALEMNASCSYWISARDRITSQLVVYEKDLPRSRDQPAGKATSAQGYILPQVIPMGTITRRAVENTWLTASNAKKNRVGSELKAMVKAPPGYSFVGADVDSEELWIASVLGDAIFKIHGGNAIGFMTLEGTKSAGTDLHSRTASILGISRSQAKIFNYGRIYGAGLKFAGQLLHQFDPSLSDQETSETATKLYTNTKGIKTTKRQLYKRPFWRGGTESFVFNKLEEFAEQERPRTPVLGAGITEALMSRYISKGGFLTSRINWAIQSSGVDYLHLLIVSMDYLIRRFNIDARLAITVHDEIRYLVKDQDRYRAGMALQVSNLWTRAMFAQQVGINDLPQSCAFFSAVDIDHVLRKEVDMDCITPSHSDAIPPGVSLDVSALLAKGEEAALDESVVPEKHGPRLDGISYAPRTPVMETLQASDPSTSDPFFIRAQITADNKELQQILSEKRRAVAAAMPKKPAKPRAAATKKKAQLPYYNSPHLMPTTHEPVLIGEALSAGSGRYKAGAGFEKGKFEWERRGTGRGGAFARGTH